MTLGQEIKVIGNWFVIHFTENPGMAFGMEFAGDNGKLFLTLFRVIAAIFILFYLYRLAQKGVHLLLLVSISMIFAGAVGNILDSVFYGVLFNQSTFFETAKFLPGEGGYAPLFYGSVVDMLYFPIIKGQYPSWLPFLGSQEFIFFRPVFNLADSSITIGVLILISFQHKFFKGQYKKTETEQADIPDETEGESINIEQESVSSESEVV